MAALFTRDCIVFEEIPVNVSVTELKGMGQSPIKWRVQNNAPAQLSWNPLPLPKMTEYFAGTAGKDKSWLCPTLDRGNKSPLPLEDTFPDCTCWELHYTSCATYYYAYCCWLDIDAHHGYFCVVLWGRLTFSSIDRHRLEKDVKMILCAQRSPTLAKYALD